MGEGNAGPSEAGRTVFRDSVSAEWGNLDGFVKGARLLARLRHLRGWERLLAELGFNDRDCLIVAERARANGTSILSELIVSGRVDETDLFRALARHLDLRFLGDIRPGRIVIEERQAISALRGMRRNAIVTLREDDGGTVFVIAPRTLDLPAFRDLLTSRPDIARRLVMSTPSQLRRALMARAEARLAHDASAGLFERQPEFSARNVANAWQGFAVGLGVGVVPVLLSLWPAETLLAVTWCFTILFLGCIGLRLLAALDRAPAPVLERPAGDDAELPHYSILVPLHREETVLPDLLMALGRIDWPRSKLEVKLICEADDTQTLSALEAYPLRSWIEIVRVPPGGPRTKPNALNFALPTCTGDLVALYDAEDRPHPLQLRAAWAAFRAADDDLACVQAPLRIANSAYGPLPLLFGIEYAAHFRGLLHWLACRDLLIPLGGTSNHFRRGALEAVGGWDAHNVTEDADLGVRLTRFGFRIGTIDPPTLEDAPEQLSVWFRQRARWFKGYMQTWLVHMRHPARLFGDLGAGSFLIFQILIGGVMASAMLHPLLLFSTTLLSARFVIAGHLPPWEMTILYVGALNVLAGYGTYLLLGWNSLDRVQRAGFGRAMLLTPVYWLALSVAGYMAVWEIIRRPHHWAKTPHWRYRRAQPALQEAVVREAVAAAARAEPRQRPATSRPRPTILSSYSPMTASSRPA